MGLWPQAAWTRRPWEAAALRVKLHSMSAQPSPATLKPPAALAPLVVDFRLLPGPRGRNAGSHPQGALTHAHLNFSLGRPMVHRDPAGRTARLRGAVMGPSTGPSFLEYAPDETELLSVGLEPAALPALFGCSAREFADRAVPLEEAWGRDGAELVERLIEEKDGGWRLRIVSEALLRRLERARAAPAALRAALDCALSSPRRVPVAELAARAGLGRRQLHRLFREWTGLDARTFSRVLRFRRAMEGVKEGVAEDWAGLALDCGFADQSHMTRDFREFLGTSPAAAAAWWSRQWQPGWRVPPWLIARRGWNRARGAPVT